MFIKLKMPTFSFRNVILCFPFCLNYFYWKLLSVYRLNVWMWRFHQQDLLSVPAGTMASPAPLTKANTGFCLDLFSKLGDSSRTDNVFFSPFSISSALAMVMLGARGNTASQMSEVQNHPKKPVWIWDSVSKVSQEELNVKSLWRHGSSCAGLKLSPLILTPGLGALLWERHNKYRGGVIKP